VGAELMRRFRKQAPAPAATLPLRTAGALRARAEVLAEQRREVLLAREAKERLRREREQTAARDRHLNTLAKRQAAAWRQVEALVITKRPGDYDEAVTLLQDLREIGERKGRPVEVTERIRALRELHRKEAELSRALKKGGVFEEHLPGISNLAALANAFRMLALRGAGLLAPASRGQATVEIRTRKGLRSSVLRLFERFETIWLGVRDGIRNWLLTAA
jgi:hypothetical protein